MMNAVLDEGRVRMPVRRSQRLLLCGALVAALAVGPAVADPLPPWYPDQWPSPYQEMTFSIDFADPAGTTILANDSF